MTREQRTLVKRLGLSAAGVGLVCAVALRLAGDDAAGVIAAVLFGVGFLLLTLLTKP